MAGVIFVFHMAIWFYLRNYLFPWVIYTSLSQPNLDFNNRLIIPYFYFCLSCLWVMHCYWFSIFVKIISSSLFGGKLEDVYDQKKSSGKAVQPSKESN